MNTVSTNNQGKMGTLGQNPTTSEMMDTNFECATSLSVYDTDDQLAFEAALGDMGMDASQEWLEGHMDFNL